MVQSMPQVIYKRVQSRAENKYKCILIFSFFFQKILNGSHLITHIDFLKSFCFSFLIYSYPKIIPVSSLFPSLQFFFLSGLSLMPMPPFSQKWRRLSMQSRDFTALDHQLFAHAPRKTYNLLGSLVLFFF